MHPEVVHVTIPLHIARLRSPSYEFTSPFRLRRAVRISRACTSSISCATHCGSRQSRAWQSSRLGLRTRHSALGSTRILDLRKRWQVVWIRENPDGTDLKGRRSCHGAKWRGRTGELLARQDTRQAEAELATAEAAIVETEQQLASANADNNARRAAANRVARF